MTDDETPTTALPTDETAPTTALPTDDDVLAEQPFAPASAPDPDRTGPRPPGGDAVWSSSSLTPAPRQAPRRPRPFTLVWGLALLVLAVLPSRGPRRPGA